MANVNPPPALKIPLSIDPKLKPLLEQVRTILSQLWTRTGGPSDAVDGIGQNLTSTSSRVSRNIAKINSIELKEFEIKNTTVDLTTEEFQIIICKNTAPIVITLDTQAIENDEVHIKRRGASIEVTGSIDGFANKTINVLNYSMHLVFDGADWSEI